MSTPHDNNDDYGTAGTIFNDTASGTDVDDPQFMDAAHTPPTLPRPTGPSWSTIALGLIALVVAGGALFIELTDLHLDWERFGPLAVVGMGLLLVLVGLAALMRRSDDEDGERS